MKLTCSTRDVSPRQPKLEEFSCCGTATLCCLAQYCGETILSTRGQHDRFLVPSPVLLNL
jgi:hypothetical protein